MRTIMVERRTEKDDSHLQRPYLLKVLILLILNEIADFSRSNACFAIEES